MRVHRILRVNDAKSALPVAVCVAGDGAIVKGVAVNELPMDVVVVGRRFDVPDDVRDAAAKKAGRLNRYLPVDRAEVSFSRAPAGRLGDPITCEIVLEGRGRTVRVAGTGGRPLDALDDALEKARLQLSRVKGKLVGRSRPRRGEGRGAEGTSGGATEDEGELSAEELAELIAVDGEGPVDPEP